MLAVNQLSGFWVGAPLISATTGTFGNASTGGGGRGVSAGAGLNAGFQFTAPQTGTVLQVKVNCTDATASGTYEARLYTNSVASPGTQVGVAWGSQVISATGDRTFSGGAAAITASTLYWIVLANTAGTPNLSFDTCTDDASYGSGRNSTITSITNGLPSSEDWRLEITYEY